MFSLQRKQRRNETTQEKRMTSSKMQETNLSRWKKRDVLNLNAAGNLGRGSQFGGFTEGNNCNTKIDFT